MTDSKTWAQRIVSATHSWVIKEHIPTSELSAHMDKIRKFANEIIEIESLKEKSPDTTQLHEVLCQPCGQTVWKADAKKEPKDG